MTPTRRTCLTGLLAAPAILLAARAVAAPPVVAVAPGGLAEALRAAAPGTRLDLAPGDHGVLTLAGAGGQAGAPVTLAAADPGRPPVLSGLDLRDPAHLVFDGIRFAYRFAPGDPLHLRPFRVAGGRDLTFAGCRFEGDLARGLSAVDDGHGTGFGLAVRGVTGFRLTGCRLESFYNGLSVSRSRDLHIAGNDLRAMRQDGMKFAEVQAAVIADNYIHDFDRALDSADHADMIQFFTARTASPSRRVTIRGNLLSSGRGWYTQSVFMRNDRVDKGEAGPEMFYRDILIEENAILNAHLHGITVGETDGLVIRNNTLVRNARSQGEKPNPGLWTPQIRIAEGSRDVTVTRNVVARIAGWQGQPGWHVTDNLFVQDVSRLQPGHYDDVFSGDPADPDSFAYRKGGPLDGAGIGARRFQR